MDALPVVAICNVLGIFRTILNPENTMKYDRITIAIEHGGIMTTSKNVHGIRSTMHWKGREPIVGDHHTTLPDAMTSLNSALEDHAADEYSAYDLGDTRR